MCIRDRHERARYVGLGWMAAGIALYVIYRRADETSLLRRVTVAPQVLRAEQPRERDYGSVLVPLFGTELDDDRPPLPPGCPQLVRRLPVDGRHSHPGAGRPRAGSPLAGSDHH